jgi:hypothetical protein
LPRVVCANINRVKIHHQRGFAMGRNVQRGVRALVLACGTAAGLATTGGAMCFTVGGVMGGFAAGAAATTDSVIEGTEFVVGAVEVVYAPGTAGGVSGEDLRQVEVDLVRQSDGLLIAPGSGDGSPVTLSLSSLSEARTERFDSTGLRAVLEAIHERYTTRTGGKAYVVPDATQVLLRGAGEDYRSGSSGLRFVVYPSRGTSVRSAPPAKAAPADAMPARTTQPTQSRPAETPPAAARETRPQASGNQSRSERATPPAAAESESAPAPIVETTDPDDLNREPPARMDQREPVRIATPTDERVYDPADLPVDQFELDAEIDGETPFEMTGFEFEFPKPHPELPTPEALGDVTVRLIRTPTGFVAREGEGKLVRLGDLGKNGPDRLYYSAFDASLNAVLQSFRAQSIVGVLVTPDPDKGIGPDEVDRYYDERIDYGVTTLPLLVYVPQVTRLKTIASGNRIDTENRLDSPKHARIKRGSPLQPGEGEMPNALLRFEPLNTYAFQQSRHPGRRVDVAIADGERARRARDAGRRGGAVPRSGDQALDDLCPVLEHGHRADRPVPSSASDSSTTSCSASTTSSRSITSRAVSARARGDRVVRRPDLGGRPLRAKVEGEWTDYRASDVGVANEQFDGRTYGFGGELRYNFLQVDDFFVDVYGGASTAISRSTNLGLIDGRGQEEVFVFDVGLRAERVRANYSIFAEVGLEISANGLTGANETDLERLGRLNPDEDWTVLHWDVDHSFYLDGVGSWNAGNRQLVHEIATRFSGQYAFNNRLIPNYQTVGGGLYTVRGYRESLVAGDSGRLRQRRVPLPPAQGAAGGRPDGRRLRSVLPRPDGLGGAAARLGLHSQGVPRRGLCREQPRAGLRERGEPGGHRSGCRAPVSPGI